MIDQHAHDVKMLLDALDKAHMALAGYLQPGARDADASMQQVILAIDNEPLLAARSRLETDEGL